MKTTKLLLSLFIIVFIAACSQKIRQPVAKGVEIRSVSTYMGEDTYQGYHTDSFTVYRNQYSHDSLVMEEVTDSSGQNFKTKLASRQWKHRYFIFHKDSSYGYYFVDYPYIQRRERARIDSALHSILGSNNFDNRDHKPDSFRVIQLGSPDAWKEVLTFNSNEKHFGGSLHLYYSKRLNHLKETLNAKLDSGKGAKFYKYEMHIHAITDSTGRQWPPSLMSTEIKEIILTDTGAWNAVIRAYSDFIRKSR